MTFYLNYGETNENFDLISKLRWIFVNDETETPFCAITAVPSFLSENAMTLRSYRTKFVQGSRTMTHILKQEWTGYHLAPLSNR